MTVEEFQTAVKSVCLEKEYDDLHLTFNQFITAMFNTIDTDDCFTRQAVASIDDIDKAFDGISESADVCSILKGQEFTGMLSFLSSSISSIKCGLC